MGKLRPLGHRLGTSNWDVCCQGTLWSCTCSSPRVQWLATAGRVRGQGVKFTVLAVMPHTMLHKYEITFNHRAALPNPQEPAWPWASAAGALAWGQLCVGLTQRPGVCESQAGVECAPPVLTRAPSD